MSGSTFAIAVNAPGHRADRKQRAREEEREDRHGGYRADVGPVEQLSEAECLGEVRDLCGGRGSVESPELCMKLEVRAADEAGVDHGLLEDDAAHAAREQRLRDDVIAREPGGAARRDNRRREHADRRRLAGAVGAKRAEHLAGRDAEIDALDGLDPARIRLRQPLDGDRRSREQLGRGNHVSAGVIGHPRGHLCHLLPGRCRVLRAYDERRRDDVTDCPCSFPSHGGVRASRTEGRQAW
ncbi:MAG TPA: hypothetical protein VMU39_24030 [Solirubrobacteraceae bacterium]|nr:hypothetical protein [Solirubrobacteraceae bacterium]